MKKIDYSHYHRDREYRENEDLFRNIFEKRYLIVRKYFAKPGKILEIGSSRGLMLDIFKKVGWKTWGADPSQSSEDAKEKDHRIIKAYFEKAILPENYFDLIIANHTLEHMDEPLVVLKKANQLLKKGGIIFIDVPNVGSLSSKILGKHWPYLRPDEHKHQFTRKTLSNLLSKAGFKVIHFESRSGLFEYAHPILKLWQSLIHLKMRFITSLITFPYALVATFFNMGDSMSLVAKKK